jgi:hypothetical protein
MGQKTTLQADRRISALPLEADIYSRDGHVRFGPIPALPSRKARLLISEKKKTEKTQAQIFSDAFEGMKGRQPKSDKELKEWLATDEGKQATMFEPTLMSRWGETGRA